MDSTTSEKANEWVSMTEARLRAAGHRSSAPRSAVLDLIGRQGCVATAPELADRLRDEGRSVGVATVYRTLELLERMRLVQRLDVGDGTARYEAARAGGEHHHHLVCDDCGRVTPFEDEALERSIHDLARRLDYAVAGHEVIMRGRCPDCVAG